MKLLIDMNLSPRWADWLNAAGFESVHWSKVGANNAPDSLIMDHAREEDYIVLTHDLDFGGILAATHGDKPSVIQIRAENLNPDVIGQRIANALRQVAVELEQGALVTIDPKRTRLTILLLDVHK